MLPAQFSLVTDPMKPMILAVIVALAIAPVSARADDERKAAALRSSDSLNTPSFVFTPQAVWRRSSAVSSSDATPPLAEFERPGWSPAQKSLLGLATMIACNVLETHCTRMPSAPTPMTAPGGESWQLEGCKAPNLCPRWMYPPP